MKKILISVLLASIASNNIHAMSPAQARAKKTQIEKLLATPAANWSSVEQQIDSLLKEFESKKLKLPGLRDQFNQKKQSVAQLGLQSQELQQVRDAEQKARKELKAVQDALQDADKYYQSEMSVMQKMLDQREKQFEAMQRDNNPANVQAQQRELDASAEQAQTTIKILEQTIKTRREQVDALQTILSNREAYIKDLEKKIGNLAVDSKESAELQQARTDLAAEKKIVAEESKKTKDDEAVLSTMKDNFLQEVRRGARLKPVVKRDDDARSQAGSDISSSSWSLDGGKTQMPKPEVSKSFIVNHKLKDLNDIIKKTDVKDLDDLMQSIDNIIINLSDDENQYADAGLIGAGKPFQKGEIAQLKKEYDLIQNDLGKAQALFNKLRNKVHAAMKVLGI